MRAVDVIERQLLQMNGSDFVHIEVTEYSYCMYMR